MAKLNLAELNDPCQVCVLVEPKSMGFWLSFGSLVFVVMGVFLIQQNETGSALAGWLSVVFFGFCLGVGLFKLFGKPDTLTLDHQGLTLTNLGRSHTIMWDHLSGFGTYNNGGLPWGPKMVGLNMTETHKTKGTALANSLSGFDGALPTSYGVKPRTLADALQRRLEAHWKRGQGVVE